MTTAPAERLARLASADALPARRSRLLQLAHDAGSRWRPEPAGADHGELLYDEQGLPR